VYTEGEETELTGAPAELEGLALIRRARAHALQEAIRWGEPYIYFVTPGVTSWVVPMVNRTEVLGGVEGGDVLSETSADDWEDAIEHLMRQGATRKQARVYLERLPVWPQARCREAAYALYDLVYAVSGWQPTLLIENKERSQQQRQIAEEIHKRKEDRDRYSAMDEEQILLSLIRAGDQKNARNILNQMLGRVFLRTANLTVIRASMIEMMGYLVRRAVEDSALLEPLMERNHRWMARIIETEDFEGLAAAMRSALDDFMNGVYELGYAQTNRHVHKAMRYIAGHYCENVSLRDVARETGLSSYRLAHLIKEQTGKSLISHVHFLRIKEARKRLADPSRSIADIAADVGYYDQSHFTRRFREYTGLTPARYRRAQRG